MDTFTVKGGLRVEDEDVGDGTYGYLFEFIAPNGESSMSDAALFEIKDGHITSKV